MTNSKPITSDEVLRDLHKWLQQQEADYCGRYVYADVQLGEGVRLCRRRLDRLLDTMHQQNRLRIAHERVRGMRPERMLAVAMVFAVVAVLLWIFYR